MHTKSWRLIPCVILLLLIVPFLPSASVRAAESPVFTLTSSTGELTAGGYVTVEIHAEQVSDLIAYEWKLSVDPAKWTFVEAASGMAGYQVTPEPDLHASGVITLAFTKIGAASGENGSVNLGHVTLQAKTAGSGQIQLTDVKLVDSDFTSVSYAPDTTLTVTIVGSGSQGGNPGGPGSPIGGSGPADESQRQVVDEASLKPDGSGTAVVDVADGKRELLLPANAAAAAALTKLEIRSNGIVLTIDPVVLRSLTELLDADEREGANLSVKLEQAPEEEAAALARQGSDRYLTVLAAGAIYRLDLSIVAKDGSESKLNAFEQPVELSLPYDDGADESVLGIYYYNEDTQAWEYVGGAVDKAGKRIVARLNHFSAYGVLEYRKTFADVPSDHWAYEAIRALAARHVVSGISNASYAPGKQVTRAEFAALLSRTLGLQPSGPAPFADVAVADWYADDVSAAYHAGLIAGRSPQAFAPQAPIKREEMAALLVRAFEFGTGTRAESGAAVLFSDQGAVSSWAASDIQAAVHNGLMSGRGGGQFAPAAITTRAEAAAAVHRLLTALDSLLLP